MLTQASEVNDALNKTEGARKGADEAINTVLEDIEAVNNLISEVNTFYFSLLRYYILFILKLSDKTKNVQTQIDDTTNQIKNLNNDLGQLQNNITNNYNNAKRLQKASNDTRNDAKKTYEDSVNLQTKYQEVQKELTNKTKTVKNTKQRAEDLFERALKLMTKVSQTENEMSGMNNNLQEEKLNNLENVINELINQMTAYTRKIEDKSIYYNICN